MRGVRHWTFRADKVFGSLARPLAVHVPQQLDQRPDLVLQPTPEGQHAHPAEAIGEPPRSRRGVRPFLRCGAYHIQAMLGASAVFPGLRPSSLPKVTARRQPALYSLAAPPRFIASQS